MGHLVYWSDFQLLVRASKGRYLHLINCTKKDLVGNPIPIAVASHWSLIAENYHDPLIQITKIIVDKVLSPLSLFTDYSILVICHTVGPERLPSAMMALGAQCCLPIGNCKQKHQIITKRMDLM